MPLSGCTRYACSARTPSWLRVVIRPGLSERQQTEERNDLVLAHERDDDLGRRDHHHRAHRLGHHRAEVKIEIRLGQGGKTENEESILYQLWSNSEHGYSVNFDSGVFRSAMAFAGQCLFRNAKI